MNNEKDKGVLDLSFIIDWFQYPFLILTISLSVIVSTIGIFLGINAIKEEIELREERIKAYNCEKSLKYTKAIIGDESINIYAININDESGEIIIISNTNKLYFTNKKDCTLIIE